MHISTANISQVVADTTNVIYFFILFIIIYRPHVFSCASDRPFVMEC